MLWNLIWNYRWKLVTYTTFHNFQTNRIAQADLLQNVTKSSNLKTFLEAYYWQFFSQNKISHISQISHRFHSRFVVPSHFCVFPVECCDGVLLWRRYFRVLHSADELQVWTIWRADKHIPLIMLRGLGLRFKSVCLTYLLLIS